MVDHWKALANRLGTPGIDEPEERETTTKATSEEAARPKPKQELSPPPAPAPKPPRPESSVPSAVERDRAPAVAPQAAPQQAAPQQPAPYQPAPQQPAPPAAAPASSSVEEKPAKRRKSSWETLASLFSVSVDRPEEKPVVSEKAEPQTLSPTNRLAEPEPVLDMFKPTSTSAATPLDDMFGDSGKDSLKLEGWGKPRRVVDDVSWDEPDELDTEPDVESDTEPEAIGNEPEGEPAAGDEEPTRRRRRRRRGRRGRTRDDEAAEKTGSDDFDSADEVDESDRVVSWKVDTLDVESAGPWAEPDTFESDVRGVGDDDIDDEVEGEVLRRSSRRRRRRGREDEGREVRSGQAGEPTAERSDRRPEPSERRPDRNRPSERSSERTAERTPERTPERTSERAERPQRSGGRGDVAPRKPVDDDFLDVVDEFEQIDEVDEREPTRSEREPTRRDPTREPSRDATREDGRRPRRRRPVDSPARASRSAAPLDDDGIDDEVDAEETQKQHRNIPTWLDALDCIITANTENHKRNEGRGGGGGRSGGRPRGRR